MAGIAQSNASIGWSEILFRPAPSERLHSGAASVHTVRGLASINWAVIAPDVTCGTASETRSVPGSDAGTGDDDDPGGQYAPLWKIWALLRPNLFSSGPEGDGRWEMLGMFVVCIGRANEISLQTEIVRMMDVRPQPRHIPLTPPSTRDYTGAPVTHILLLPAGGETI